MQLTVGTAVGLALVTCTAAHTNCLSHSCTHREISYNNSINHVCTVSTTGYELPIALPFLRVLDCTGSVAIRLFVAYGIAGFALQVENLQGRRGPQTARSYHHNTPIRERRVSDRPASLQIETQTSGTGADESAGIRLKRKACSFNPPTISRDGVGPIKGG